MLCAEPSGRDEAPRSGPLASLMVHDETMEVDWAGSLFQGVRPFRLSLVGQIGS